MRRGRKEREDGEGGRRGRKEREDGRRGRTEREDGVMDRGITEEHQEHETHRQIRGE